jgi:hypothetical protein
MRARAAARVLGLTTIDVSPFSGKRAAQVLDPGWPVYLCRRCPQARSAPLFRRAPGRRRGLLFLVLDADLAAPRLFGSP